MYIAFGMSLYGGLASYENVFINFDNYFRASIDRLPPVCIHRAYTHLEYWQSSKVQISSALDVVV